MPVSIRCACGAQWQAPDSLAGWSINCPQCSAALTVPSAPSPVSRRQRTYAFEHAYSDYAARLRGALAGINNSCRAIWVWFWSGKGCKAIEMLLKLAGVIAGVMYLCYEIGYRQSFGASTLLLFLVIVVWVYNVTLGLEAPIHWLARLVSGASAAGLFLSVGLSAAIATSLIFSFYLAALFVLTAASFLVFLPLRGAQELALVWRRIAYECPHDKCPDKGKRLPTHLCPSCGAKYKDLKPSFYGIFFHTCRHGDGTATKLPTMDWLGRYRLPRRCSGCQEPLEDSPFGPSRPIPLVVVGPTHSGKTVLLRQGMGEMLKHFDALPGAKSKIASGGEERALLERDLRTLRSGGLPTKTTGTSMKATSLAVRMPDRRSRKLLIQLYDSPGEHFETLEEFSRKQVFQRAAGILLVVDPFLLPGMAGATLRGAGSSSAAQTASMTTTGGNLIQMLSALLPPGQGRKFDTPLAVVLTKADAVPREQFPELERLCPARGPASGEAGDACRQAVSALGGEMIVRMIDKSFSNVRYFAASALGRNPDGGPGGAFTPRGVLEPFLWLLGMDAAPEQGSSSAQAARRKTG